jgi:hypothetical protein
MSPSESPSKSPSGSPSMSPSASPSAAVSSKGFVDTFSGPGPGHQVLVKREETIQYYLEMSGSDEGIARIILEYTTDGGQRWKTEKDSSGSAIDYTGTASSPLTTLVCIGQILNQSGKDKVYRWRCVSMDRTTSAALPCYLYLRQSIIGAMNVSDGVYILVDDEAPTNGIDGDGAGYAGKNSLFIDTSSTGLIYRNDGDSRLVNWTTL